jgi:uncharacterized membrane protein
MLNEFFQWLATTPGSIALHESLYWYAYIETVHTVGIMLFVGTILAVDARLLGVGFRNVAVSQMLQRVLPWTIAGFVVMAITGVLLVYAIPVRTWHSVWFRVKVVLLIVGFINIWHFHHRVQQDVSKWDTGVLPPVSARVSASVSILVWCTVIVLGRLIAYGWFDCDRPQPPFISALASCAAYPTEM